MSKILYTHIGAYAPNMIHCGAYAKYYIPGRACQCCNIHTGDRRFSGNLWKSATSSPPELKEI